MDFAVLLKVVPDLVQLRFSPETKTVVREGQSLYGNPFDLRALLVALELRRPGETVTVISMGPPAAEGVLKEALAQGVDRALLVTDRALAGSDTLVTSRTLARALGRVGHDVVLCGLFTTDSETGQVGPEIAGLLGVPIVSGARAIQRDAEGTGFEVTADTPDGWARVRLAAPFVVSVDEKIVKLKRPTPAAVAAIPTERVERLTAGDLGLAPGVVGHAGSPTVVEALEDLEPARHPLVLADGPLEERIRAAVARLEEILAAPAPVPVPLPPRAGPLGDSEEVLLLVTGPDGALEPAALPLVSEVRRSLAPLWPSALWVGGDPSPEARTALARAGALRLLHAAVSSPLSSRRAALAIDAGLDASPRAAAMMFLADPFGREVAGQVAARRGLGLTGDAVGIVRGPDGELRWRKPAFGGGIVAAIRSKTRPSLGTVRPGVLEPGEAPDVAPLDPTPLSVTLPAEAVEVGERGHERADRYGNLDHARVVVTVGMGVGGSDHLSQVEPTLTRWRAALAATRRVVDAGWLPRQLQVGLTGRSLAPDLGVLLGVSGAANHLVGWKRARALLAVNVAPQAPVFRAVDVGVVGRWEEVLPGLTDALAPLARRLSGSPP